MLTSRVTMAASRVVTGASGTKLMRKLTEAEIKTWMKSNYVDDGRLVINLFTDLKWNNDSKKFVPVDKPDVDTDDLTAITRYCSGEIKKCLDSLNPDLTYVMELESDFNGKLPTLDTNYF